MSTLSNAAELFHAPIRQRPKAPDEAREPEPEKPNQSPAVEMVHPGFVINPKPDGTEKYLFRMAEGMYVDYNGAKTADNRDGRRIFQCDRAKGVHPIIGTDQDLNKFNGKHTGMKKKFDRINRDNPDVVVKTLDPTERHPGETVSAYLARMNDVKAALQKQTETMLRAVDSLTLEQVQEFAAAEEIDLKGAKTVEEARKLFKAALKG